MVDFYTHVIPEYSFFNQRQNAQETMWATTLATALPVSLDNQIHLGDGICFIKVNESLVEVFEDSDEGLGRTLYLKAKRKK